MQCWKCLVVTLTPSKSADGIQYEGLKFPISSEEISTPTPCNSHFRDKGFAQKSKT